MSQSPASKKLIPKLEQHLKKHFGFTSFRYPQRKIIARILEGKDVLAILPTGKGKSLCYQLPAAILPPTTLVISPLIALMKDQVDALNKRSIRAGLINSSQSSAEQKRHLDLFQSGYFKLLYVSPERLHSKKFKQTVGKTHISLIAVDEAHCISQWGHEFRPEYLQISSFIEGLKIRPPIIALTATASAATQKEIVTSLRLTQAKLFRSSIYRPNLQLECYSCPTTSTKLITLLSLLIKHSGRTCLVYSATRKSVMQLFNFFSQFSRFRKLGLSYYHGGLDTQKRKLVQNNFITQKSGVMFATNAFGMGIDRSDIRLIVHYHLPATLEAYAQEIGRAGRDGKSSRACLLFFGKDLKIHQGMIASTTDSQLQQAQMLQLKIVSQFVQSNQCRNNLMKEYFAEKIDESYGQGNCGHYNHEHKGCGHCDNCIKNEHDDKRLKNRRSAPQHPRQPTHITTNSLLSPTPIQRCSLLRNQLNRWKQTPPTTFSSLLWWSYIQPKSVKELCLVPGIGEGWVKQFSRLEVDKLIKLAITET